VGADHETAPSPPPTPPALRRVSQRYELLDLLGRGSYGEVWRARDLAAGEDVAIKLLDRLCIAHPVRVRREIATLRRLRLPGVVRLLDEGVEGTLTFISMELVSGRSFPGPEVAGPADVLLRTSRLLEVLARVHAQGVVHRDLKPANVLVDERGRVTLLDFGIALGLGEPRISSGFDILGTPAYLAPEQVSGEAIGPRADLYTVGVMLFEALTGELPFDADGSHALLFERVFGRPRELRVLRPDLPVWLGDLVGQLLARSAHQRPRSAHEVLARLRAGGGVAPTTELPWIGRVAEMGAVEAAVDAGRSVLLRGAHGCGASRFVRVLAEGLTAAGRRVHCLRPEPGTFGPLRAFVGDGVPRGASLPEVRSQHAAAVTERLRRGEVILVDDLDALDPASVGVLRRCGAHGSIIAFGRGRQTLDGAEEVPLGPLAAPELGRLFHGPERIFHLISDGAALLAARTGGLPGAVAEEIDAWCAAGLATWDGAGIALDRDAIERITLTNAGRGAIGSSRARSFPPSEPGPRVALAPMLEGVLDAVLLATTPLGPSEMGSVLDLAEWEVEAALEDLSERGLVAPHGDGCAATSLASAWELPGGARAARRAGLHRRLGALLPADDERRVHHFLGAHGDVLEPEHVAPFVDELLPVARAHAEGGRTERARVFLGDGVATIRRSCELSDDRRASSRVVAPALRRVLEAWVPLALTERVPRPLDRVLHELARAGTEPAWGHEFAVAVCNLDQLTRAALTALHAPARSLAMVDAIARFDDPTLELARIGVRVRAARAVDAATEASAIDTVADWCETEGGVQARVALLMWRSIQHYGRGQFVAAAECAEQGAALATDVLGRIAATADAAAARLEAFHLEDAARLATSTREAAAVARQPYYEAIGTWLERTIAYRMQHPLTPDRDLVDEVARLAVPHLEALVALTEATFALRAGERELCRTLAARTRARWREAERRDFANLGAALEIQAGGSIDAEALDALLRWALSCQVPGLGLQALALLRDAWPEGWAPPRGAVERLSRQVPEEHWTTRIDVLSAQESRLLIGDAAATDKD
jgi:hypothetical protein